jgi:hypothetical protein
VVILALALNKRLECVLLDLTAAALHGLARIGRTRIGLAKKACHSP